MSEGASELAAILARNSDTWVELRSRDIAVTTDPGAVRALHRPGDIPGEAERLASSAVAVAVLEGLCSALAGAHLTDPCVVDILQAADLVARQGISPETAIVRSRLRYQGTDGVRGRVARGSGNPLADFTGEGLFTAGLCELLSAALMMWQRPAEGTTVVVAEDGRDPSRGCIRAAIDGFRRFGCSVVDLGIAPTPTVPAAMAAVGARYGAAVTASHNPSNQNGIKFFEDGRKILPDPGDYATSAYAFFAALEGLPGDPAGGAVEERDPYPFLESFLGAGLEEGDLALLRGARLVVDTAHGAFSPHAEALLRGLGLDCEGLCTEMTGDNINRDSGVAYIEGRESVAAADIASEIAVVGRVRELALDGSRPVFGIVLDGDGDRGLLVVHDGETDTVRIIDGDRLGYTLAKSWASLRGREGVFAGTVESDLAVFAAAESLGIDTVMTPVGDKWLSSDPSLTGILIGEEASGHAVWPVKIGDAEIVTGNGMLTGLLGAAAIMELGLAPAQAAEPYEPGVCRTFYTYFVERSRFYRGSPVWLADIAAAQSALDAAVASGELPEGSALDHVDFANDEDMLYLKVVRGGGRGGSAPIGAVFARNSGTENKIATYARGDAAFAAGLESLAAAVNGNHVASMKDDRLAETRAGEAIAAILTEKGSLTFDEAARAAEEHGVEGEGDLDALILALVKEARARRAPGRLLSMQQ